MAAEGKSGGNLATPQGQQNSWIFSQGNTRRRNNNEAQRQLVGATLPPHRKPQRQQQSDSLSPRPIICIGRIATGLGLNGIYQQHIAGPNTFFHSAVRSSLEHHEDMAQTCALLTKTQLVVLVCLCLDMSGLGHGLRLVFVFVPGGS